MLNRKMRGFGTILFDMVPKVGNTANLNYSSFGTILFDMVPKGVGYTGMPKFRFGTVRFITTLNTFSVFIFTKIWHTINMNKVD